MHLLHRIQIACLQPTSTKPSAIHRSSVPLRTSSRPPSASPVLHLLPLLQTDLQLAILCPSSLHHYLRILINYRFHMQHSLGLILSDVMLDSSSLVSSLSFSFLLVPSSSLTSSSSIASASSRSFCNLCACVITFTFTFIFILSFVFSLFFITCFRFLSFLL